MEIKRTVDEARHLANSEVGNPSLEHVGHLSQRDFAAENDSARPEVLGKLADFAREATDQPQYFWQRQQAAIRSRIAIEQAMKQPWDGLFWAAGLALLLIASVATIHHSVSPASPYPAAVDPDQELLMSVEQAVQSGVPEALEPAALLADEISAAEPSGRSELLYKEKHNAN